MSIKPVKIGLVLVMAVLIKDICIAKEVFDIKLGAFNVQDTKGEKSYTCFNEISAGVGKYIKDNIVIGLEMDYYRLPANYNLWGTTIDRETQVLKNFLNCEYIIKQDEKGFMGVTLGYDFGYSVFRGLLGGQTLGDIASWKLMFEKGFRLKGWNNKMLFVNAGLQNNPVNRVFAGFGILFETNILKGKA